MSPIVLRHEELIVILMPGKIDYRRLEQVTTVAMESTGVYWIPVFQILEARGFEVVLVNARLVRSAPGRKSDVADCEWLRHLHSAGLLRGSFRPPDEVCALRTPSSPSTPEPGAFVLSRHLTRLFGTDLTLIPGIGESIALTLFAELGANLSRFPDAAHFASWLNLCPLNKITDGRIISSKTGPGSNRAAQALRMATQALHRSHSSLGDYFRRKRARLGTPQAITATAHKMARIIYHLVTHHVLSDDTILDQHQRQNRKRRERHLRNQARALGFDLVPQPA